MSTTADSIRSEDDDIITTHLYNSKASKRYDKDGRLILRARENIFKPSYKCRRALKQKLKKYKLRKDGEEDPDVLDVSKCLSTSLKIKSPNASNIIEFVDDYVELKYTNYLVKMAKPSSQNKVSKKEPKRDKASKENSIQNMSEQKEIKTKCAAKQNQTHPTNSNEHQSAESTQNKAKEMNAFQLMMHARNKSIGSNSPGKEKTLDLTEDEVAIKQRKVKRNLALEKMAEDKGALKNQSLEALKDERIKEKMNQRAKRLKKMLTKNNSTSCSENEASFQEKHDNKNISGSLKKRRKSDTATEKATKRLKTEKENKINHCNNNEITDLVLLDNGLPNKEYICKVGNSSAKRSISGNKISRSDVEFLNNLSPSIKKKESMLSYFGKVEKSVMEEEECIEILEDEITDNVIKVKFTPKTKSKKLKLKKKKIILDTCKDVLDLKKSEENIHIELTEILCQKIIETNSLKSITKDGLTNNKSEMIDLVEGKVPKLKKNSKLQNEIEEITQVLDESPLELLSVERPRRSTKKPVKYQDSDDDLHIFTPKKNTSSKETKALTLKSYSITAPQKDNANVNTSVTISKKKPLAKKNDLDTKKSKLAPIFAQKLSKAELEAKQRFLHSGIPTQVKTNFDRQKSRELEADYFLTVYHVQQKTMTSTDEFDPWALTELEINLNHEDDPSIILLKQDWNPNLKYDKSHVKQVRSDNTVDYKEKLKAIKKYYPKFPVYRTFRLLKDKCRKINGENSQRLDIGQVNISSDLLLDPCDSKVDGLNILNWTEKFRPTSTNEIIGNYDVIKTLKKWLITWKENTLSKSQHQQSESSDSSDFCYSDTDSRDSMKSYNNVLIVTGPVGCGKTCAIYAVATELAIKVIEVNASTKRTGKKILSDLQEATQSHKVNRLHGISSLENSQNSQNLSGPQNKKKSKYLKTYSKKTKSKQNSQPKTFDKLNNSHYNNETIRTAMSLILIDDADLVFEQDDGFISALSQIVHSSKRPVIIVASSVTCPHLQRFISSGNIITFSPLPPKMLGTWLDILCLVENGDIWPNMGQNLLDYCKGDIRKAINTLQFWVASDHPNSQESSDYSEVSKKPQESEKVSGADVEDECSGMSWSEHENPACSKNTDINSPADSTKALFRTLMSFNDHDIGIRNSTLQFPVDHTNVWCNYPSLLNITKDSTNHTALINHQSNKNDLNAISALLDNISASDFLFTKPSMDPCVTSIPWASKVCDSVSEAVDMSSYSSSRVLGESISFAMLSSSLRCTEKAFTISEDSLTIDYTLPGMAQRRSRDKIINRHRALQDGFTLSSQLDRRGLAADYWATCREICRIEKLKGDQNSKRNNRFCHYLKSMKGQLSTDTLEKLCDSLSSCDAKCKDES